MLEDIAKQKMHNRALQAEMDALREHPDTQVKQVKIIMYRIFVRQLRGCHSFHTALGL